MSCKHLGLLITPSVPQSVHRSHSLPTAASCRQPAHGLLERRPASSSRSEGCVATFNNRPENASSQNEDLEEAAKKHFFPAVVPLVILGPFDLVATRRAVIQLNRDIGLDGAAAGGALLLPCLPIRYLVLRQVLIRELVH